MGVWRTLGFPKLGKGGFPFGIQSEAKTPAEEYLVGIPESSLLLLLPWLLCAIVSFFVRAPCGNRGHNLRRLLSGFSSFQHAARTFEAGLHVSRIPVYTSNRDNLYLFSHQDVSMWELICGLFV